MSDYEAAAHILRAPSYRERLADAVTYPIAGTDGWNGINWEEVQEVAQTFSDGELVLVNAAAALFSGRSKPLVGREDHAATLPNLMRALDDAGLALVLEGVRLKRGVPADVLLGKIYAGRRLVSEQHDSGVVWVIGPDGRATELTLHTPNGSAGPKSPDGHAWGYDGSGPAQLALDILWNVFDAEPHPSAYQAFKRQELAALEGDAWAITEAFVKSWARRYDGPVLVDA